MTTMMPVERKCALCGALNKCYECTSTNNFGGMDTEFRSYAVGSDPIETSLQTCSECGYTHYDIEKVPKNIAATKELVKNFIEVESADKKTLPTYKNYELVGRILILDRAYAGENSSHFFASCLDSRGRRKVCIGKNI